MPGPNLNLAPWWNALILGGPKRDRILPISANINAILRADPAFAGRFGMDKLRNCTVVRQPLPWDINGHSFPRDWREHDDRLLAEWLQRQGVFVEHRAVGSCVETVAEEHAFHPVIDYFKSISWDGEHHRLDTWTVNYLGCPDTPYVRAVWAKWMISAVARIMEPGCKADCVLVLEGVEDLGKSTVFRKLAVNRKWFTDEISALGTKDAAEQLRGIWIVELAELDALTRAADVAAAKAAISRQTDRYRPSYGFRVQEFERQCVFGATSNRSDWNRDDTGGRRFWPLVCNGDIKIEELESVRDQLWAEAYTRYLVPELWYLDKSSEAALEVLKAAREEQAKRHETDAWEPLVLKHLADNAFTTQNFKEGITIATVMGDALYIRRADIRRDQQMRVSTILRTNGWIRKNAVVGGGLREWRYFPPGGYPLS